MTRKKTKREHQRSLLAERQLILRNIDKYQHLIKLGYSEKQVVKKLIKGTKMDSLSKLKHRIQIAKMRVGVSGVSLDNIRITEEVKKYIKKLVQLKVIQPYYKGQKSLKLVKPRMWVK